MEYVSNKRNNNCACAAYSGLSLCSLSLSLLRDVAMRRVTVIRFERCRGRKRTLYKAELLDAR